VIEAGALWAAEGTNFRVPFGQVKEQSMKVKGLVTDGGNYGCLFYGLE
jgi:hypothetical protein